MHIFHKKKSIIFGFHTRTCNIRVSSLIALNENVSCIMTLNNPLPLAVYHSNGWMNEWPVLLLGNYGYKFTPCDTVRSRYYTMTSSIGNIFCVTGPLCWEFIGPGEFPTQRPVRRSFDVFFDLRLNKRLSKQPWGWWFETHRGHYDVNVMMQKKQFSFFVYVVVMLHSYDV